MIFPPPVFILSLLYVLLSISLTGNMSEPGYTPLYGEMALIVVGVFPTLFVMGYSTFKNVAPGEQEGYSTFYSVTFLLGILALIGQVNCAHELGWLTRYQGFLSLLLVGVLTTAGVFFYCYLEKIDPSKPKKVKS